MRILMCLLVLARLARADGFSLDLDAKPPHASPEATRIASRPPRIPAVLASGDAAKQRYYEQIFAAYEHEAAKRNVGGDLAAAIAVYLAGSYAVYRNTDVSDAAATAVIDQVRDRLAANPQFQATALAEKQDLYESMVILGVVMMLAHDQHQDAALRTTARSYLESFLHADPDTIELTDRGLARVADKPVARPTGKGPAVAAMVWSWRLVFDGSSYSPIDQTYLLLADGSCTTDLPPSLDGFDPAASRAAKPKDWCTWRKAGKEYQVAWSGKFETLPKQVVLEPGRRGAHLDGLWNRSHGATIGTASTWTGRTVTFKASGSFSLETATAFDTGAGSPTSRGPGVTAVGSGDASGTYALDGYTLELRFANGTIERTLYGAASDGGVVWFRGGIVLHKD